MCCTSSELTRLMAEMMERLYISVILHLFYLQDIKAYHSLPLPGYVVNPVSLNVHVFS